MRFLELIGADHAPSDENLGPVPTLGHGFTTPKVAIAVFRDGRLSNEQGATARLGLLDVPSVPGDGESVTGLVSNT